jgi:hypothetical protein
MNTHFSLRTMDMLVGIPDEDYIASPKCPGIDNLTDEELGYHISRATRVLLHAEHKCVTVRNEVRLTQDENSPFVVACDLAAETSRASLNELEAEFLMRAQRELIEAKQHGVALYCTQGLPAATPDIDFDPYP